MEAHDQKLVRWTVGLIAGAFAVVLCAMAFARFSTFHNETFDLAFYTRMAWGIPRGSFWDPIVNAHIFGLHLSPVLVPLGLLGFVFGTAKVLLVAQVAAVCLAVFPLADVAKRRGGTKLAIAVALVWFMYPNLGHVATYEFHPATMAVLPLAFLLKALDEKNGRRVLWWSVGLLLFREDLGLVSGLLCLVAYRSGAGKFAALGAALSFAWVALFLLVLHPLYGPEVGSLELHFGKWGGSAGEIATFVLTHPGEVASHFATPARLSYLPLLLLPLALLPLLSWRAMLIASPMVGINLFSSWPTAVELDSHYQTILLPILVFGAIEGVSTLQRRRLAPALVPVLLLASGLGMWVTGGYPWSRDFVATNFQVGPESLDAAAILAYVPSEPSVQAPYELMPHLAERTRLGAAPPPDRDTELVILDLSYRRAHRFSDDLLRTEEEPTTRLWLSREDYGTVAVEGRYVLFRRGADPRALIGRFEVAPRAKRYQRLTDCLEVADAKLHSGRLTFYFRARHQCPADLALRFGTARRPRRVDLLFDGLLSPAHLQAGDSLRSTHDLDPVEAMEIGMYGLRAGLVRQSGARPVPKDPVTVRVDVR